MSDAHSSEAQPYPQAASADSERARARRKTTSAILLHRAVKTLGADVVAPALGLTPADLERLDHSARRMSLEQQRTLGMAVLVLSDGHPDLRRGAIALLAQIRAAVEFASGATERHVGPPPTNRW